MNQRIILNEFVSDINIPTALYYYMIIYFINNEDFRGDSFNILRDSFGFTLYCSVIGGENWQNAINQSDTKVKRLLAWLHASSRASRSLRVYSSVPHWLLVMFFFVLIGH